MICFTGYHLSTYSGPRNSSIVAKCIIIRAVGSYKWLEVIGDGDLIEEYWFYFK